MFNARARQTVVRLVALAQLATLGGACGGGSSTGPQVPDIPLTVGAYCASTAATIAHDASGGATVTVYRNVTTSQDVRRADGVVIRQEVHACTSMTCVYGPTLTSTNTDAALIATCQSLLT